MKGGRVVVVVLHVMCRVQTFRATTLPLQTSYGTCPSSFFFNGAYDLIRFWCVTTAPRETVGRVLLPYFYVLSGVYVGYVNGALQGFFYYFGRAPFKFRQAFQSIYRYRGGAKLTCAPTKVKTMRAVFFSRLCSVQYPSVFATNPFRQLLQQAFRGFSSFLPIRRVF